MKTKKLGIIGGLGPAATAYLFDQIVSKTDAATDQDHLDITILNRPQTPDRTAFLLGDSDVDFVPSVCATASDLVTFGCEVICLPCVTAHAAFEEIKCAAEPAYLVSLLDEIAKDLHGRGCDHVGILATRGTIATGFLQRRLEECGFDVGVPDALHQDLIESLIYDEVKAGRPVDIAKFERSVDYLYECGCDSVVLGCTELPLIDAPVTYRGMYVADSLQILARAAILACGARVRA